MAFVMPAIPTERDLSFATESENPGQCDRRAGMLESIQIKAILKFGDVCHGKRVAPT